MAKINVPGARTAKPSALGALSTNQTPDTKTYEGADAHSRDAKSDLFLLITNLFLGEETFYEKADDRTARLKALVHQVANQDPAWLYQCLKWARTKGNIRTASVVAGVEAANALKFPNQLMMATVPSKDGDLLMVDDMGWARKTLGAVLVRPDEPQEALAYWLSRYGRKIPAPVRRAIADAAVRMYTERNVIKYGTGNRMVSMADVIELCHPEPKSPEQSVLFKYLLDRRRGQVEIPESLQLIAGNKAALKALQLDEGREQALSALGESATTWEQLSSTGKMDKAAWEAAIPTMKYMALLRNLRNFQEAGVSPEMLVRVGTLIGDPEAVAKSKQLPYRFYAAYMEATNPIWAVPLESAIQAACQNIPALGGKTLVLVDTSGSMHGRPISEKSKVGAIQVGGLFGIMLAARGEEVDLYNFADTVVPFAIRKGAGVLRELERFNQQAGRAGGGTQTAKALKATFKGHDRVIIITDEQTFGPHRGFWQGDVSSQIPENVPIYSFNIAGYAPAMLATSTTRHQLGGLTDATFAMIQRAEMGLSGKWPWEEDESE